MATAAPSNTDGLPNTHCVKLLLYKVTVCCYWAQRHCTAPPCCCCGGRNKLLMPTYTTTI